MRLEVPIVVNEGIDPEGTGVIGLTVTVAVMVSWVVVVELTLGVGDAETAVPGAVPGDDVTLKGIVEKDNPVPVPTKEVRFDDSIGEALGGVPVPVPVPTKDVKFDDGVGDPLRNVPISDPPLRLKGGVVYEIKEVEFADGDGEMLGVTVMVMVAVLYVVVPLSGKEVVTVMTDRLGETVVRLPLVTGGSPLDGAKPLDPIEVV